VLIRNVETTVIVATLGLHALSHTTWSGVT